MNLNESDRLRIVEWAVKHPEILRIFLYGSRARGDNRPDSDIDLAIQMHAPADPDDGTYSVWSNFIANYRDASQLELTSDVHLEWYEPGAGLERVGPAVERDGIQIYP